MSKNVERKCYLYRAVHRETGKDYVGISVNPERRWMSHQYASKSSPFPFHRALLKHGAQSFDWKIIGIAFSWNHACALERLSIALGLGYYNATKGGDGRLGCIPTAETRELMRQKKVGARLTEDHKRNIGTAHKGRVFSAEHLEKIRLKTTGQKRTEQTKARMRAAHKHTPTRLGQQVSAETRTKMSNSAKNRRVE